MAFPPETRQALLDEWEKLGGGKRAADVVVARAQANGTRVSRRSLYLWRKEAQTRAESLDNERALVPGEGRHLRARVKLLERQLATARAALDPDVEDALAGLELQVKELQELATAQAAEIIRLTTLCRTKRAKIRELTRKLTEKKRIP